MRLPKFLYEIYPVLYIAGGIGSMSLFHVPVAFLSGLLLAIGGTVILFMRRNYRASKRAMLQMS